MTRNKNQSELYQRRKLFECHVSSKVLWLLSNGISFKRCCKQLLIHLFWHNCWAMSTDSMHQMHWIWSQPVSAVRSTLHFKQKNWRMTSSSDCQQPCKHQVRRDVHVLCARLRCAAGKSTSEPNSIDPTDDDRSQQDRQINRTDQIDCRHGAVGAAGHPLQDTAEQQLDRLYRRVPVLQVRPAVFEPGSEY